MVATPVARTGVHYVVEDGYARRQLAWAEDLPLRKQLACLLAWRLFIPTCYHRCCRMRVDVKLHGSQNQVHGGGMSIGVNMATLLWCRLSYLRARKHWSNSAVVNLHLACKKLVRYFDWYFVWSPDMQEPDSWQSMFGMMRLWVYELTHVCLQTRCVCEHKCHAT